MTINTRSKGAGGGFGVTARTDACAVLDCENQAKPQVCPYDNKYHGHGAIHYDCGYPESSLRFRFGDWFWVCDTHYQVLCQERAEFEARRTPC